MGRTAASSPASTANLALLSTVGAASAAGITLVAGPNLPSQVTITMSDGSRHFNYSTDPTCSDVLASPGSHFVGVVANGGLNVVTFMVDGGLCDGGGRQPFGWSWFGPLGSLAGSNTMTVATAYGGELRSGHFYSNALTTSQLVGNYRAAMC